MIRWVKMYGDSGRKCKLRAIYSSYMDIHNFVVLVNLSWLQPPKPTVHQNATTKKPSIRDPPRTKYVLFPRPRLEPSAHTWLEDSLEDVPYHLVARPGNELCSELLKSIARLFMKIDRLSVRAVSDKHIPKISSLTLRRNWIPWTRKNP